MGRRSRTNQRRKGVVQQMIEQNMVVLANSVLMSSSDTYGETTNTSLSTSERNQWHSETPGRVTSISQRDPLHYDSLEKIPLIRDRSPLHRETHGRSVLESNYRGGDMNVNIGSGSEELDKKVNIQAFIVPVGYPQESFTEFDVKNLKKRIKRRMREAIDNGMVGLKTIVSYFNLGTLCITTNLYTRNWLEEQIRLNDFRLLKDCEGRNLRFADAKEIPAPVIIDVTLYLPQGVFTKEPHLILDRLANQNPGLETRHWIIKDGRRGQNDEWRCIELSLNKDDLLFLEKCDMKPRLDNGQALITLGHQ